MYIDKIIYIYMLYLVTLSTDNLFYDIITIKFQIVFVLLNEIYTKLLKLWRVLLC